ncbi:class I SAM-dependent methyltransferase [Microvirga arabica]|uniref:class I SAM-dependent methyltransferase n=1 Tax=Microvirga arabica TaxID=1128671 RepID=UPI00193A74DE|nr:class I SAM-dependent methyltransferase [Microvirga arabica]MBM1170349.1 class I SAM-dependent methyltransferase [Microvirga arabica]
MSVEFYNLNAGSFFALTVAADMSEAQNRFLCHVPKAGRILDAGCGSGRDAKAFVERGYEVEAFDASAEMVRMSSEHSGLPVRQMTFEQVDWDNHFDGIWASASLLHVPRSDLSRIIAKLRRALKPEGILYLSFKYGMDDREKDGRRFTDMNEEALQTELRRAGDLNLIEIWTSEDVRPGRTGERWLSALSRRAE